jgi:hypothetical protein
MRYSTASAFLRYAKSRLPVSALHSVKRSASPCAKDTSLEAEVSPPEKSEPIGAGRVQSAEALASKVNEEKLITLEAKAFEWIARGRAANLELGRLFLQIKVIVGHGRWEHYYEERFGSCGIAKRTAQTYMDLARECLKSKTADSAFFPPATDPHAQAIVGAAEDARAAVARAVQQSIEAPKAKRKIRVRRDGIYKLPLSLTGREMAVTDELRESPQWAAVEMEIIALLEQLHIKYVTYSGAVTEITRDGDAQGGT